MAIPKVSLTLVEGALGIPSTQTDNVIFVIGHCTLGTVGTIYSFDQSTPTTVKNTLGVGKLAQCVAQILQTPDHGPVYAIPCTATTAGSNSAVTSSGTAPPAMTLTGTPNDDFRPIVQILAAGARGTATFRYSLDNGVTWSAELTTAATYLLVYPDGSTSTGVTLNFPVGTYSSDNKYTFTCTAPLPSNTDITTQFDTINTSGLDFAWVHVIANVAGTLDTDRATALGALFAAVQTKMDAFETAYKYAGCSIEAPMPVDNTTPTGFANWRAALVGAAASLVHKRMMVVAGYCLIAGDLDPLQWRRPGAWSVVARLSKVPISEHLGRVRSGSLRSIVSIEHDEEATGGLDSSRFTTLRTMAGRVGFWITRGRQFAQPGSDYSSTQNLRVINSAAKIGRNALLTYLNDTLIVDKTTGKLRSDEADAIDVDLTTQLSSGLAGNCSSAAAKVGRNDNILSTGTISGEFDVQPFGYPETINFSLGFTRAQG